MINPTRAMVIVIGRADFSIIKSSISVFVFLVKAMIYFFITKTTIFKIMNTAIKIKKALR